MGAGFIPSAWLQSNKEAHWGSYNKGLPGEGQGEPECLPIPGLIIGSAYAGFGNISRVCAYQATAAYGCYILCHGTPHWLLQMDSLVPPSIALADGTDICHWYMKVVRSSALAYLRYYNLSWKKRRGRSSGQTLVNVVHTMYYWFVFEFVRLYYEYCFSVIYHRAMKIIQRDISCKTMGLYCDITRI